MKQMIIGLLAVAACGGSSGGDSPDGGVSVDASMCGAPAAGAPAERVRTTSGTVHGAMSGSTWAYLGVPYVAQPVGALRFAAPAPAVCSPPEIDASALGPACPQLDDAGNYLGAEDCLRVNVWAPAAAAGARPVMVWIHGGANVAGTAADPLYDGRRLAEAGDVVVVTLDYRIGQLGFADSTDLSAADPAAGNFGLLDQIAALQWVHDNIAGFGGDPGNVTVFGESAGARDTCSVVASPRAAGLFHRAIMESGSCRALPTKAIAQQTGATFVTAAGCTGNSDVIGCLRGLSAEAVVRAAPGDASILVSTPYQPEIDGTIQPVQPFDALRAGTHNHVPFMVGANADETGRAAPAIASEAAYEQIVDAQFGALSGQVLSHYPASDFATPRAAYVRLTTDSRFVCPSRSIARAAAAGRSEGVYRYFFRYPATVFGAVHGIDVPFVFGTFDAIPYQPTATDLAVSAAVQHDWTTFARTGAPAADWPTWTTSDPSRVYDTTVDVEMGIRDAQCDFWDLIEGG